MKTTNLKELLKAEIPMWFKPKDEDEMLELQMFMNSCDIYFVYKDYYKGPIKQDKYTLNWEKGYNILTVDARTFIRDEYYCNMSMCTQIGDVKSEDAYFYDLATGKLEIPGHDNFRRALRDKVEMSIELLIKDSYVIAKEILYSMDVNFVGGDKIINAHIDTPVTLATALCDMYGYIVVIETNSHKIKDNIKQFDFENDRFVDECKWPNLLKRIKNKENLSFCITNHVIHGEFCDFMAENGINWDQPTGDKPLELYLRVSLGSSTDYNITDTHKLENVNSMWDLENDRFVEEDISAICPSCGHLEYELAGRPPKNVCYRCSYNFITKCGGLKEEEECEHEFDTLSYMNEDMIKIPKSSPIYEEVLKLAQDYKSKT